MTLPQDNFMLLSMINMKLRDQFQNLDDLCRSEGISRQELEKRLAEVDYHYNPGINQFR